VAVSQAVRLSFFIFGGISVVIWYNKKRHKVNDKLLIDQCATQNLFRIIEVRNDIDDLLESQDNVENIGKEKEVLDKLTECEYALQELWNFKKDSSYHMRQFSLTRCLCGYIDNRELIGVEGFWFDGECPYHGDKE
jgi:hypothetical protein